MYSNYYQPNQYYNPNNNQSNQFYNTNNYQVAQYYNQNKSQQSPYYNQNNGPPNLFYNQNNNAPLLYYNQNNNLSGAYYNQNNYPSSSYHNLNNKQISPYYNQNNYQVTPFNNPNNLEDTITVITYNICHGVGLDKKLNLERIAKVVKTENPDIVAFQEVDVKTSRTRRLDEPKILGDLSGFKSFFGKSIPLGGGEYGNAIIAKDQNAIQVNHFPLPGKEPRSLIAVQARTSKGNPFIFACTHLCLDETNRIKSVGIINNWVTGLSLPTILVGDMNCKVDSTPYKKFIEKWDSTWGGKPLPTFPSKKPTSAIDHCLTYPKYGWKVIEIKVIDEPIASDHRPLKITLNLSNKK